MCGRIPASKPTRRGRRPWERCASSHSCWGRWGPSGVVADARSPTRRKTQIYPQISPLGRTCLLSRSGRLPYTANQSRPRNRARRSPAPRSSSGDSSTCRPRKVTHQRRPHRRNAVAPAGRGELVGTPASRQTASATPRLVVPATIDRAPFSSPIGVPEGGLTGRGDAVTEQVDRIRTRTRTRTVFRISA